MKLKMFCILMVGIAYLPFTTIEGACMGFPEPDPPEEVSTRVEQTDALVSVERDAQYPGANTPDAIPTVPAEIQGEGRQDVSNNPNPVHENWYEGMETSGVDVY